MAPPIRSSTLLRELLSEIIALSFLAHRKQKTRVVYNASLYLSQLEFVAIEGSFHRTACCGLSLHVDFIFNGNQAHFSDKLQNFASITFGSGGPIERDRTCRILGEADVGGRKMLRDHVHDSPQLLGRTGLLIPRRYDFEG